MKTVFASILLAFGLAGAAQADTTAATEMVCDPSAAAGQATDDCTALRVAYLDRVNDCMAERKAAADLAVGSTHSNGPHTNRARHLLCTAEVRDAMGIVAK